MNREQLVQLNDCIRQFGARQKRFMRGENRALLRSMLFDVPRRSSIGWRCFYEKAPGYLRELVRQIPPEEIGRRMRRLCSRPYYLQLSILMCSCLGARQQLLLDHGLEPGQALPGEDIDDLLFVVGFWQRACRAYRSDGLLFPDPERDAQPVLPMEDVRFLNGALEPMDEATHQRLRRLAATLELYVFILHGEQRDGLFGHGPYDLGDGSQLVVLEFNDLRNDYLPWARTADRLPFSGLALARRVRGLRMHFDMFGGIRWDAAELAPFVEAEGLFSCSPDGAIEVVPKSQWQQNEETAAAAQNELFLKAAEWTPRYKAAYGAYLFANHLLPFFQWAGDGVDWGRRIADGFAGVAEELLDDMLAEEAPPSIWNFMATTEGDYFWPVVADEA